MFAFLKDRNYLPVTSIARFRLIVVRQLGVITPMGIMAGLTVPPKNRFVDMFHFENRLEFLFVTGEAQGIPFPNEKLIVPG